MPYAAYLLLILRATPYMLPYAYILYAVLFICYILCVLRWHDHFRSLPYPHYSPLRYAMTFDAHIPSRFSLFINYSPLRCHHYHSCFYYLFHYCSSRHVTIIITAIPRLHCLRVRLSFISHYWCHYTSPFHWCWCLTLLFSTFHSIIAIIIATSHIICHWTYICSLLTITGFDISFITFSTICTPFIISLFRRYYYCFIFHRPFSLFISSPLPAHYRLHHY